MGQPPLSVSKPPAPKNTALGTYMLEEGRGGNKNQTMCSLKTERL